MMFATTAAAAATEPQYSERCVNACLATIQSNCRHSDVRIASNVQSAYSTGSSSDSDPSCIVCLAILRYIMLLFIASVSIVLLFG
jgi:hypothetical protein